MARTQLTSAQVTGSAIDIKSEVVQYVTPTTAAALTGSDIQDIVGALAAAVQRIHGKASSEVFNQAEGTFDTSIFDVNSTGAVTIDSSGGAISIGADDVNQNITIGGDGTRAIQVGAGDGTSTTTVNSRGGTLTLDGTGQTVDIDGAAINIDGTGAISLDGVGNSNWTTLGGTLILSGADGAQVIAGDGEVDITAARGAVDINASAAVTIDAGAASNFSTSAGALTLDGQTGVNIQENGASIIAIADNRNLTVANAAAIDIDGSGAITIDSSGGAISIGADDVNQNITIGGNGTRTIQLGAGDGTTTATVNSRGGTLTLDGTGQTIDVDGAAINIDGTGVISLDGVGNSNFTTLGGTLALSGANGVTLQSGDGELDLTAPAGAVDINAGAAVTIDAAAASSFTTSAGALTIEGKTGVLIKEDGTTVIEVEDDRDVNIASGISGATITLGHGTSETIVGDNLTVTGDLIVVGATTTVSSSNLVVQDSIIGLGISGSAATGDNFNNVGDRAIIFARGAADYSALPALSYDGSEFELATFNASPTSQSMGNHVAGVPLRTGHLKPISDDGAALGDIDERWSDLFLASEGVIDFDNGNFKLTHSANALTIDTTDKLQFRDANSYIHSLTANDLAVVATDVTIDAAGDIFLDADGGNVFFQDGGLNTLVLTNSSGDVTLETHVSNADLVFKVNSGGTFGEVARFDGGDAAFKIASGKELHFGDAGAAMYANQSGYLDIEADRVGLTGSAKGDYAVRIWGEDTDSGVDIDAGNTASGSFRGGYIQITGSQRTDLGSSGHLGLGGATGITAQAGGQIYVKAAQDANSSIFLESLNGGIDIFASGSDAKDDIDIGASRRVRLQSALDAVDAIVIDGGNGPGGGVQIIGGDKNDVISIINSPLEFDDLVTNPTVGASKLYAINNQLMHDGNVLLSGSSSSRAKITTTITASVPSGSALDVAGFDFGGPSNNTLVDVFVNGQLMASGGAADYRGEGSAVTTVSFTFGLEADDIVIFTKSPM